MSMCIWDIILHCKTAVFLCAIFVDSELYMHKKLVVRALANPPIRLAQRFLSLPLTSVDRRSNPNSTPKP